MLQDYLASTTLTIYPLVAMTIFLLAFAGVLAHTFLGRKHDRRIDRLANIPFEDEVNAVTTTVDENRKGASR
jgi:hypothetical protein